MVGAAQVIKEKLDGLRTNINARYWKGVVQVVWEQIVSNATYSPSTY